MSFTDKSFLFALIFKQLHGFAPLGHKKSSITYIYIIKKAKFCHFYFFAVYPKIYVDKYPEKGKSASIAFKRTFCSKIGVHIGVLIRELSIFLHLR